MPSPFTAIRKWHRRRLRAADVEFLLPEIMQRANSMQHAAEAFATHCINDPSWTADFTRIEICAEVGKFVADVVALGYSEAPDA